MRSRSKQEKVLVVASDRPGTHCILQTEAKNKPMHSGNHAVGEVFWSKPDEQPESEGAIVEKELEAGTEKEEAATLDWQLPSPNITDNDAHRQQRGLATPDSDSNGDGQGQLVRRLRQGPLRSEIVEGYALRSTLESALFSAPGMAIMMAHFPAVTLLHRFGARVVLPIALSLSAFLTFALPYLAHDKAVGLPALLFLRFLLGISVSPAFPFLAKNALRWATLGEQLFFILSGFLALQFGPALSWMLAFSLASPAHPRGIDSLFVSHAAFSVVLALVWALFYRDWPHKHSLATGEELTRILQGKQRRHRHSLPGSLACILFRSSSAWACWLASLCYFVAIVTLQLFLPPFLYMVIRQPLGHSVTFPFILLMCSHLIWHWLGSLWWGASRCSTWSVRLFNSVAFLFSALLFIGASVVPKNELYSGRVLWLLWLCLLPLGLSSIGFIRSAVHVGARHFTGPIVANMGFAFGMAQMLVPSLLCSFMIMSTTGSYLVHWRLLFLSCALLLLLGMSIFFLFGRGTPAGWAEQCAEQARTAEQPLVMVQFSELPPK